MGTISKSKEKSQTQAKETTTPTYQQYAGEIANTLTPGMQQAYLQSMEGYGAPGMNEFQQNLWSQVGNRAQNQWGIEGPYASTANAYMKPYMGTGYMQTLEPYYQKQQQYIENAMPAQQNQFMRELKRQFGPAWGTHGQALAGAADSYANFQAAQAQRLADLYGQKGAAAERGMGYSASNAGTYANMQNPFTWGQQAFDWAGKPEAETSAAAKEQQALATGWINPLMQLATMGYTFPQSTTTEGTQTSRGETAGKSAGMSCCFIMNEAGDLTKYVRTVRDAWCPNRREDIAEGYYHMAEWLVPMMKKSSLIKNLVKYTMTHPIAVACERRNPALYPIGIFWLAVWKFYGRVLCPTSIDTWKRAPLSGEVD